MRPWDVVHVQEACGGMHSRQGSRAGGPLLGKRAGTGCSGSASGLTLLTASHVGSQGPLLRATAATGMKKRSSRSHAIFTIALEQRRTLAAAANGGAGAAHADEDVDAGDSGDEEAGVEDYLCAKMHLVDLAGARCCRDRADDAAGALGGPLHSSMEQILSTKRCTCGSCERHCHSGHSAAATQSATASVGQASMFATSCDCLAGLEKRIPQRRAVVGRQRAAEAHQGGGRAAGGRHQH